MIVAVQGTNCGGEATANLIRVANQEKGNSLSVCLLLDFYKYGKEAYGNLQKTIFNERCPINIFYNT